MVEDVVFRKRLVELPLGDRGTAREDPNGRSPFLLGQVGFDLGDRGLPIYLLPARLSSRQIWSNFGLGFAASFPATFGLTGVGGACPLSNPTQRIQHALASNAQLTSDLLMDRSSPPRILTVVPHEIPHELMLSHAAAKRNWSGW